ncbi:MbtH family protein [Streptantibioticus ferralitis]|uniref:MbtH family protein n=1 Tax=Streptantibioticus ferralitis TaxID=236510 RepID=A0ABT5ZBF0_9ACTN|nr:MbtH family protein [Streptantibioticus ferralitis]MDF2261170.1 MbtH family protein [Streptantibioticus ferralitis]
MAADDTNRLHDVVINHERQYSVWPADSATPAGWSPVGFTSTLDECLAYVDRVWTDLRPQSLRDPGASQPCGTESG